MTLPQSVTIATTARANNQIRSWTTVRGRDKKEEVWLMYKTVGSNDGT